MDTKAKPRVIEGLKVVDTDTHYSEPHDLWSSRVSGKWKTKLPHVKKGPKGHLHWYINDDEILMKKVAASSCIRLDGSKQSFWEWDIRTGMQLDEVEPGSYDGKARVKWMDKEGVDAHIMYGNVLGFGGHRMAHLDPEVALMTVKVYNDAMAEMQAESNNRLFPQAIIPFWDLKEAVKETERCATELKLRGVTMCPEPHENPALPPLTNTHWDPLWEAVSEFNLPINFHVGSGEMSIEAWQAATWPGMDKQRALVIGNSQLELYNARILANLLTSDLLVRFPKTNWVFVESGLCWIPYIIERLEWQLQDTPFEGKGLEQPGPRELFQRQVYSMFWFEEAAPSRLLDLIGIDNVMFETDFPHPTCLYPNAVEQAMKVLAPWDDEVVKKVMGGNAARLYNLPI